MCEVSFFLADEIPSAAGCDGADPQHYKGLNPYREESGCAFKKCCKKYKRGKRCKKCPKR